MSNSEHESLEWALKNGDLQQVKAVLSKSQKLANESFPSGRHPLVVAADYGHTELIGFLISEGADVNVKDKHGITPLLAAIFENHIDSVKLLLEKGACKTEKSPSGESYFDCAETDEVKVLLK